MKLSEYCEKCISQPNNFMKYPCVECSNTFPKRNKENKPPLHFNNIKDNGWCRKCFNLESCHKCDADKLTSSHKIPTHFVSKDDYTPKGTNKTPKDINYETATEEIQKGIYEVLGQDIGKLVDEKNLAYGDSVNTSAEAFKLLYPDGIKPEQYSDALLLVRIWDKMKRIATKKGAFDENPYADINGYSLLGMKKDEAQ